MKKGGKGPKGKKEMMSILSMEFINCRMGKRVERKLKKSEKNWLSNKIQAHFVRVIPIHRVGAYELFLL